MWELLNWPSYLNFDQGPNILAYNSIIFAVGQQRESMEKNPVFQYNTSQLNNNKQISSPNHWQDNNFKIYVYYYVDGENKEVMGGSVRKPRLYVIPNPTTDDLTEGMEMIFCSFIWI